MVFQWGGTCLTGMETFYPIPSGSNKKYLCVLCVSACPMKSLLHLFHRGGANYKQTNNQQKDGVIHETEKGAGKGPKNTLGSG